MDAVLVEITPAGMSMSAADAGVSDRVMEVSIDELVTDCERFRLVRPREYVAMRDSIEHDGQTSPVLAGQSADDTKRYELVDGFKRYRACRELGKPSMKLHVLRRGSTALKAALKTRRSGYADSVILNANQYYVVSAAEAHCSRGKSQNCGSNGKKAITQVD